MKSLLKPAILLLCFAVLFFLTGNLFASESSAKTETKLHKNTPAAENTGKDASHNEAENTGAEHEHHPPNLNVSPLSIIPFAVLLLGIAILPLVATEWWEKNKNKALFAIPLGIIALLYVLFFVDKGIYPATQQITDASMSVKLFHIIETMIDYIAFIALLASLFIISGGIHIGGDLHGHPTTNLKILAIGGILASFIATTGAAMLLIRPLIRANKYRKYKIHTIIFFIFIVANCGGLLTPLGDPPLFLGFLKGVPFEWTLIHLWPLWLFVVGILLFLYFVIDSYLWKKEGGMPNLLQTALEHGEDHNREKEKIRIYGKINFLLILGVIAVVFLSGVFAIAIEKPSAGTGSFMDTIREATPLAKMSITKLSQAVLMAILAVISLIITPLKGHIRRNNEFTFYAIVEVAVLFFGIFLAMIPALQYLNTHGGEILGSVQSALNIPSDKVCPFIPFWLTGSLSSFLDNAPTYLTFLATTQGALNVETAHQMAAGNVVQVSVVMLMAISAGAVFMGSMTYIGNAPNFMVKSISEEAKIKMPSFFGYMIWSIIILIPIFIVVNLIWFGTRALQ